MKRYIGASSNTAQRELYELFKALDSASTHLEAIVDDESLSRLNVARANNAMEKFEELLSILESLDENLN